MICKQCEAIITDDNIKTEFVEIGGDELIEVQAVCGDCDTNHFTFIKVQELTVDE